RNAPGKHRPPHPATPAPAPPPPTVASVRPPSGRPELPGNGTTRPDGRPHLPAASARPPPLPVNRVATQQSRLPGPMDRTNGCPGTPPTRCRRRAQTVPPRPCSAATAGAPPRRSALGRRQAEGRDQKSEDRSQRKRASGFWLLTSDL